MFDPKSRITNDDATSEQKLIKAAPENGLYIVFGRLFWLLFFRKKSIMKDAAIIKEQQIQKYANQFVLN